MARHCAMCLKGTRFSGGNLDGFGCSGLNRFVYPQVRRRKGVRDGPLVFDGQRGSCVCRKLDGRWADRILGERDILLSDLPCYNR